MCSSLASFWNMDPDDGYAHEQLDIAPEQPPLSQPVNEDQFLEAYRTDGLDDLKRIAITVDDIHLTRGERQEIPIHLESSIEPPGPIPELDRRLKDQCERTDMRGG
jgi:hypothetical protein